LSLREFLGRRERPLGLILALPGLLLMSGLSVVGVFVGVRALGAHAPDWMLSGLTAAATVAGLLMALSPLLAGVSFGENSDVSRLAHFPVPPATLAVSSLTTSLIQPTVLVLVPAVLVLGFVLAGSPLSVVLTVPAVFVSFLFTLVVVQIAGLLLSAAARRRRLHDLVIFLGIILGFAMSLLPVLFLVGAGGTIWRLTRILLVHDVFVVLPFGWGVRAAIHAGRGDYFTFGAWAGAALVATAAAVAVSGALVGRFLRGDLDLGTAPSRRREGPRLVLPGALLALVEKDAKLLWRDPRIRAALATSLVAPAIFLVFLSAGLARGRSGALIFFIAAFTGLGVTGSNAFALERRGITLLLMLPTPRATLLAAKNTVAIFLRLPALVLLAAATLVLAELALLPFVLTTALVAALLAAGADNFLAILFPVPVPAPGQDPWASTAGTRGLAAAAFGLVSFSSAALMTLPFAFLAALPLLVGQSVWGLVSIPLALAGASGAYFMLLSAAARLLERREAALVARILAEE
jgi:ABC-2 type transport system permease protein